MKSIFLLMFVILATTSSCHYVGGKRVKGNGNVITESRTVSPFNSVDVEGSINVYISQGDLQDIKIEADENLMQYIEIDQDGNKLIVRNRHGFNLRPTEDMKIYITAPEYRNIEVSGACNIIGQSKINNPGDFKMHVTGAGEIKMEVDAPQVGARISGAGSVFLTGETREFDLILSGAANAHCYGLLSENTSVDISGAGDAEVYASVKLEAEVSGAGSVKYKGDAKDVKQQVHGAGSVSKVN